MWIGRDACDSVHNEIKWPQWIASSFHERNHETAKTSVHVHWHIVFDTEGRYRWNIVHRSIWEIWCRTDQLNIDQENHIQIK